MVESPSSKEQAPCEFDRRCRSGIHGMGRTIRGIHQHYSKERNPNVCKYPRQSPTRAWCSNQNQRQHHEVDSTQRQLQWQFHLHHGVESWRASHATWQSKYYQQELPTSRTPQMLLPRLLQMHSWKRWTWLQGHEWRRRRQIGRWRARGRWRHDVRARQPCPLVQHRNRDPHCRARGSSIHRQERKMKQRELS